MQQGSGPVFFLFLDVSPHCFTSFLALIHKSHRITNPRKYITDYKNSAHNHLDLGIITADSLNCQLDYKTTLFLGSFFESRNPRFIPFSCRARSLTRFRIQKQWMIAARSVLRAWSGWRMAPVATRMFAPLALLVSDSSAMIVAAVFARRNAMSFLSPRFFFF